MLEDINLNGFIWEGKPIFAVANEENMKLDELLKEKKMEVQKLRAQLEGDGQTYDLMQKHYSDVCQEISYTQQLHLARHHELEVEEHLKKVMDRERSHLLQEIQDITNEIQIVQDRQKYRQNKISDLKEKADELKTEINWNNEALENWLQESVQMEEDKVALIKYTHQDDSKIKDLTLMLERFGDEAKVRKHELDDADTDVFAAQAELDRIQQEFENAHNERKDIIANWENVLNQIQLRNKEIEDLSQYMSNMRDEEKVLQQQLDEQKDFLAREMSNNKEVENKVAERESFSAKLRHELADANQKESDLKAELETLKNIANYVAFQLRSTQETVRHLDEELLEKKRKLETMENQRLEKEKSIEDLTKKTFDADYHTQQMDRLLQEEKSRFQEMEHEFTTVQNNHLKTNQCLKEVTAKEKTTEILVKGAVNSSRSLSQRIAKVDEERLKQQAMMYKVDFYIDKTQKRLRRLAGELANEEEKLQLESQIAELKTVFDQKNSALNFLNQQVKTMMEKINVATKNLEINKKDNQELVSKIDCMEQYIMNSKKALKYTLTRKQNLLLDECLLKLQLKKYCELLRLKSDSVLSLQKNQMEYETIMKSRLLELQNSKDMIQAEIRLQEQERYKVNHQFQECMDKASKLQTRNKVIMNSLGMPQTDDNNIYVDLKMKYEDEKRELHKERENLINLVIKSEDELCALRNTLWLVRSTNEQFRQSLHPLDLSEEDSQKYQKLEEDEHTVSIDLHQSQERLSDLLEKITEKENFLNNLESKIYYLKLQLSEKKHENENINKEVNEQRAKLLRAEKSNSKLTADLKNQGQRNFEEDITIQLLRELRSTIIASLFDAVRPYKELTHRVQVMFEEANIPIPPRTIIQPLSGSYISSSASRRNRKPSDGSRIPSQSSLSAGVQSPSVITVGSDLPGSMTPGSPQSAPK